MGIQYPVVIDSWINMYYIPLEKGRRYWQFNWSKRDINNTESSPKMCFLNTTSSSQLVSQSVSRSWWSAVREMVFLFNFLVELWILFKQYDAGILDSLTIMQSAQGSFGEFCLFGNQIKNLTLRERTNNWSSCKNRELLICILFDATQVI